MAEEADVARVPGSAAVALLTALMVSPLALAQSLTTEPGGAGSGWILTAHTP